MNALGVVLLVILGPSTLVAGIIFLNEVLRYRTNKKLHEKNLPHQCVDNLVVRWN